MANERYFGRACKTCRRRGRRCDRRMPSCNTCEASGQTCEGYLLQWPGLASRGQFVGKSIPVSGTTKRRRTRKAQQMTISSSPPSTLPQSLPSPPNDNNQAELLENTFENLFDPMQLFMEITNAETPSNPLMWSNDISLTQGVSDDLVEPQLDPDPESQLQDYSQELQTSLDFSHILGPSPDILSIPGELKFIMQYRQWGQFNISSRLLTWVCRYL